MSSVTLEEALELHRRVPVVDAHCDTLTKLSPDERLASRLPGTHVDLPRLREAGVSGQFFACWISPDHAAHRGLERAAELIDRFYREADASCGLLVPVTGAEGVRRCHEEGRVAGILTVEGGDALQGNLAMVSVLHRLGVRSVTLTWNHRNAIADGVADARTGGGLSSFGVEVVREMTRLGMLIDVSHLSEAGFWDVLAVAEGPVAATHSNARAVSDHPRNLTDEQIRALAAKGGVMGLNLAPAFLRTEGEDAATLDDAVRHVEHVVGLVGPDHLGLGLDLDGISSTPEGFEDITGLPLLTRALLERGYPEESVAAILGGNFLRLMEEVGMV